MNRVNKWLGSLFQKCEFWAMNELRRYVDSLIKRFVTTECIVFRTVKRKSGPGGNYKTPIWAQIFQIHTIYSGVFEGFRFFKYILCNPGLFKGPNLTYISMYLKNSSPSKSLGPGGFVPLSPRLRPDNIK